MNKISTFEQFLATQSVQVPIVGFIINLLLAAFLAFLLRRVYIKYGTSMSNRENFSNNFILMTMVTMLVISIVKSSLALSLGLVGALSIVRFRAAIKEPEELTYLFLSIAIGLGLGADQREVTIVAFFVICGVVILNKRRIKESINQSLYLTISTNSPSKELLDNVSEVLKKNCLSVNLKRFDESAQEMEAIFQVELENIQQLQSIKSSLQSIDHSIRLTFLDNQTAI